MIPASPIDTLSDLACWIADSETVKELLPLTKCDYYLDERGGYKQRTSSTSQILYCHDMAGNYLESDRYYDLSPVFPAFRFTRWHLIDIFVYFSHHLITVPPIGWINLAHRQGVRVYGTFIIESDNDALQAILLEKSPYCMNYVGFARHLDRIRRALSFEGWLLNFEVPLPKGDGVHRVLKFIRILKSLGSEVIWYDAVTYSGNLCYQNALTYENKPFMEAARDGLFLNYNWNSDLLLASQTEAGSAAVSSRIFVGVDCFGRGCPGGGGWSTNVALQLILDAVLRWPDRPLSAALFAPAWPFENCDTSAANGNRYEEHRILAEDDERFWSRLSDLLRRIRGCSQRRFVLDRISVPCVPIPFFRLTHHANRGLLLKTTCSTGQGVFESGAGFYSSMRCQELIPTAVQLSEEICDATNFTHIASSHIPKVINFAYSRDTLTSGTCMLVECTGWPSRKHLMELFSFPPQTALSSGSVFTLSFSLPDYARGAPSLNELSFEEQLPSFAIFIDFSLTTEDRGLLRHTDPSRKTVSARNATIIEIATCPWMVMEFPTDHLAALYVDRLVHLHRFGLVWECGSSPMQSSRFLLSCVQLCDPLFPF